MSVAVPPEYLWAGWLWVILLVIHVTVTQYIALQVYRGNYYVKSLFFKLYLLHSLANYGVVNLLLDLGSPWDALCVIACEDAVVTSYYFMPFVQGFSYTAIACNRFSAIVLPLRHARARGGVTAAVYLICFLVDAVLELWTFVAYQHMDFNGKKNHNENYRLLVYVLLGMIMNTFLVSYFGMIVLHIKYDELLDNITTIVIYLQALLGPIFLVLTSKTIRRGYMEFYGLRSSKTRQITVFTTPKSTAT